MPLPRPGLLAISSLAFSILGASALRAAPSPHWVGIWSTAELSEPTPPTLAAGNGALFREIVRISHGAPILRLHLSNEYGIKPLSLRSVDIALAGPKGAIQSGTDRLVHFTGAASTSIAPGALAISDPIDLPAAANADLAITLSFDSVPGRIAGHPGSRATSYVAPNGDADAAQLSGATPVVHWYVLSAIDGDLPAADGALVCFGDSITDGHGVDPDQNARWTDALAHRLQADPATANVTVLNEGIGGNRLLRNGLGPSGLSRLQRDVLGQAGVKWVIVQLGVNDLGTRIKSRPQHQPFASADDLIAGYKQVIDACHAHGIKVALATITPFANATWYSSDDVQADKVTLNTWIRSSAACDAVVDFGKGLADPSDPMKMRPEYSSEDHLHPSLAGYRHMADLVPESFLKGTDKRP